MKKILSLLLAVMMLLSCIPSMAEEGTFTANADKYMITSYNGTDENLIVPASFDGAATPIIDRMSVNSAQRAVTLSFEEGVTQIRSNNIDGLNITQLTLPSTLEVIGSNNIYQTDKLTEVTVPAAVSYVGNLAFSYCDALTKVTFTGLCPVFAPRCFVSTASGLVVYVPDDQLDAYKAALPEELNIQPSGQKAVDARIHVAESDFDFDASTGTIKKYNGTASYIEIPASIGGVPVKTIGQKTFYQHPFITVVIVPEGVETLDMYSIFASAGLYHVELPSTLKTIGNTALWGNQLDGLILPEGLETIGDSAFTNSLTKMDELIIPDSVTSIGKEAFMGCKPVKVVIGANVQSLPATSFGTLHMVTEIVIRNMNGMTIDAEAFKTSKKGATITLMDGITEEVYNSYVEQLAVAYADATVNQPELAATFPKLDAEAGAPFIGKWNGVAATDGTDFFGMDLLGMSVNVELLDDGTGTLAMDTENTAGGWYVEEGKALFAPILEEGGQPVLEEAAPLTLDENGRMCIDFGGVILLLEKEGETYAVPAIPEKPWPELDAEKAKSYIGTWDAVSYIVDGETISADLVGSMTLILNDDGTAQMIEGEEEAYELRWYAESYSAYAGPTMSTAVELFFDMNGNLQMMQDGSKVVFAPHVDVKVIEGADELLGEWLDDIGNKLTITNDGALTHTYASDGWVDTYTWDMVDGAAAVTSGNWEGASIYMRDGIVFIDNDEGIFQLFSADGDLSAYYGEEEEYELPEAQPIGDEGEPYFGAWQCELMPGMAMVLTLNQDGTCTMDMMGEAEPGVWTMENGKAYVMGDEVVIDGDGNLVVESQGMVFVKDEAASTAGSETSEDDDMALLMAMLGSAEEAEEVESDEMSDEEAMAFLMAMLGAAEEEPEEAESDEMSDEEAFMMLMAMMGTMEEEDVEETESEEMSDEEAMMMLMAMLGAMEEQEELAAESVDPYIGVKFEMTGSIVQGMPMTAEQLGCAGDYVIFHADGSAELVMSGIPVQNRGWTRGPVTVLGEEYEDGFSIDYYTTIYNFAISADGGLLMDYFGMLRTYEKVNGEAAQNAAPAADPYVDKKFLCTGSIVQGIPMTAEQLGCAGDYVIFNADGSAELVLSGIPVQNLGWTRGPVTVLGESYEDGFSIDYYTTIYNFAISEEGGLLMDYFGMLRTYEAE